MNQILVTDKIIVTKEIRKKKKFYKRNIILSVFLMSILCSYYVYAEYDRNKYEQISKDILNDLSIEESITTQEDNTTMDYNTFVASNSIMIEDNILKVILGGSEGTEEEVKLGNILKDIKQVIEGQEPSDGDTEPVPIEYKTEGGTTYYAEATVKIPSLGIEYPVLSTWSDELLKISVNKLHGPEPNEVGNYVIIGHNYKSGKMFGKLKSIKIGDVIELKDLKKRTVKYIVSEKYTIEEDEVQCTSQRTNGRKKITLITCSSGGAKRLVVQGYEQE